MVFLAEFDHQNVIEGGDRAGPWPTGHLLILRRLCNAILVSLGRVAVGKTAVIPQHCLRDIFSHGGILLAENIAVCNAGHVRRKVYSNCLRIRKIAENSDFIAGGRFRELFDPVCQTDYSAEGFFVGDFELLIADVCKQDKVVQGQEREQEDCPAFQAGKETGIRRHGFIKQCRKKIHQAKPHDHEIMGAQGEICKIQRICGKGNADNAHQR